MRSPPNKIGTIFFPRVGGRGGVGRGVVSGGERSCQQSNRIYVWMGRDGGGAAGTGWTQSK